MNEDLRWPKFSEKVGFLMTSVKSENLFFKNLVANVA
jgi:hypothetical protein